MQSIKNWHPKKVTLFLLLGGFFVTNALIAEFIGVKIFSFEQTLGFESIQLSLLGIENLSFNMTAGVLLWPFVFVMTDLINEYFGRKGVRTFSFIAAGFLVYAFAMIYLAIHTTPAAFWNFKEVNGEKINMQIAFSQIFGQGLWIIIGSLVAFLVGQFLDVFVFHKVKALTGEKGLWLRSTGSTIVSQLVDSFIVLFIAFYIGQGWTLNLVFGVCIVNYIYKFISALLMTPIIYLIHYAIERYLGKDLALQLKKEAMQE